MQALKFLRPGRVAPFTGVTWPGPGAWLESAAPPELCRTGVHALVPEVLAKWITEELWRVELDGAESPVRGVIVARRGRLLSRVEAWNEETAREFTRACAAHVREGAAGRGAAYAGDATTAAVETVAGHEAVRVGYAAARAAEAMAPGGFVTERRWQSAWLAERIGVSRGQ